MALSTSETGIEINKHGRMLYHPEFHFNHRKPFTEEELEYLCKFYEVDHTRSPGFALGKTEHTLRAKVNYLKKIGRYEYYKKLNRH
jgi:hypothetical protein